MPELSTAEIQSRLWQFLMLWRFPPEMIAALPKSGCDALSRDLAALVAQMVVDCGGKLKEGRE